MSETFNIEVNWKRTAEFVTEKYNRNHLVTFSGQQHLNNSSAPAFFGNPDMANPEELLAAAVSSCHMLTFLAVAAKMKFTVDSYSDHAEAVLEKNAEGKMAVTVINLKPTIVFSGDKQPDPEQLKSIHDKAHHNCFVANSVKAKVNIL